MPGVDVGIHKMYVDNLSVFVCLCEGILLWLKVHLCVAGCAGPVSIKVCVCETYLT